MKLKAGSVILIWMAAALVIILWAAAPVQNQEEQRREFPELQMLAEESYPREAGSLLSWYLSHGFGTDDLEEALASCGAGELGEIMDAVILSHDTGYELSFTSGSGASCVLAIDRYGQVESLRNTSGRWSYERTFP